MVVQSSDNRFGVSTWIVGSSLSAGTTHTTITSALAAASSGDTTFIKSGTYSENITLVDGVTLTAFNSNQTNLPDITGKMTLSSGTVNLNNLILRTNSDYCLEASGGVVNLNNCMIIGDDYSCIHNTGATIRAERSTININTTGIAPIIQTGGTTILRYCIGSNAGNSTTASSTSSGTIRVEFCNFPYAFETSSSGILAFSHNNFEGGTLNLPIIVTAGTGSSSVTDCSITSGTASAITAGAGTSVSIYNCDINSTNASPVTGAGTVVYAQVEMTNTGTTIDTTTQTKRTVKAGTIDTNILSATAFDTGYTISVPHGAISNLGLKYASSTLSICSADGTALSATNPGYVLMNSKASAGKLVKYTVTADQNFIDATGSSQIIGNRFGLTTSIACTENIPFFIYAVTNDSEDAITFMISRIPCRATSPGEAVIGAPDDPVATSQLGFFSFENITESQWDANPAICIGSFKMTMNASDDWTVTALDNNDGLGRYQENQPFNFPAGQFGAASGKYFQNNGGTAPGFTTSSSKYYVDAINQRCYFHANFATCNVAGIGANTLKMSIPYNAELASSAEACMGWWLEAGSGNFYVVFGSPGNDNAFDQLIQTGTGASLQNQDIDASDNIRFSANWLIDR